MAERINIWGKAGCELPNGKLCNACCVLPKIELAGVYASVVKPANSPCPNLVDDSGKSAEGCKLHLKSKPENCKNWHCSNLGTYDKLNYIAQGLSLGLISKDEALESAKITTGKSVNAQDINLIVTDTAERLTKITKKRELIVGDVDEP